MDATHTVFDLSAYSEVGIACLLRHMVAMRNDHAFLASQHVDLDAMTEQADWLYADLLRRGYTPSAISALVPGVEVFA